MAFSLSPVLECVHVSIVLQHKASSTIKLSLQVGGHNRSKPWENSKHTCLTTAVEPSAPCADHTVRLVIAGSFRVLRHTGYAHPQ